VCTVDCRGRTGHTCQGRGVIETTRIALVAASGGSIKEEIRSRALQCGGLSLVLLTGLGVHSALAASALSAEEMKEAEFIYFDRCSGCHGALRKGATGPNITDEKMLKKSLAELEETIFEGTDAGMPGWGRTGEMNAPETGLMAKFLQLPAPIPPELGLKAMKEKHKVHVPVDQRPKKPQHKRNIDNYSGTILRDVGRGAITLIDLYEDKPRVVAEVRVCLDARSVDVSKYKGPKGDFVDRYAVVGCYWPPQMVVVDGLTLEPIKVISTRSSTYDTNEYHPEPRVATIVASHHAPEWVVAIKETGMVWLVDYSDLDNLTMTQIATERFLHDGGFDATGRYLLIAANMRDQMVVVDTKERKFVTKFETGTKPHPGRGANWNDPKYGPVSATTHLGEGLITVYLASGTRGGDGRTGPLPQDASEEQSHLDRRHALAGGGCKPADLRVQEGRFRRWRKLLAGDRPRQGRALRVQQGR